MMTTAPEMAAVPALQIPGDVDAATGHIDATSDVIIAGTIRENFRVKSTGNISIGGSIEAGAIVEAAGNVQIKGGITTQHRGKVTAGGHIHTHYCDEADLIAGGDVVINGGVINSDIRAAGRLLVEQGALVGGRAYARDGAVIKTLGNENQLKTRLALGIDPDILAEGRRLAKELKKQKEASARIRETVQPLLTHLKRLNPQQRERATELIYEADSIDARVQEQLDAHDKLLAAWTPATPAEATIAERIYRGAVVIFADKMASVQQEHIGPVKLARRVVIRTEEIIVEDPATNLTTTLVSYEYTP